MSTPSIKDALTDQENEPGRENSRRMENKEEQGLDEKFTEEQFKEKWNLFLADIDNPNLKTTLASVPEFNPDYCFVVKLENTIQEENFKSIKPRLVSFLQRELNNSSIKIATRIEGKKGDPVIYSDDEKYQAMVEQNPDLQLLRQKFNLDFGD